MTAQPVQLPQIDSPSLSGTSSTKNHADGSFDNVLEKAQEKLALATPWAQIEKMFSISSLEFDFNFAANKIENETSKNSYKKQPMINQESKNNHEAEIIKDAKELFFEYKNTEVLKQFLSKNMQIPNSTFMTLYAGNINSFNLVTRSDLQEVINQIVKNAQLVKAGNKTELSLTLSQKNLGDLFVSFILKNGQVVINIAAQSETKKLMEENLKELEFALKESKIDLKEIKITEVKNNARKFSS